MTIKEFCEKYTSAVNAKKPDVIKSVIKDNYIPYEAKMVKCSSLVEMTCYDKTNGMVKINTPLRYIHYTRMLINTYTDIDFSSTSGEEIFNGFNELSKCGVLDLLIEAMPQAEIATYDTLLKMTLDDYLANNTNTQAFITKLFANVGADALPLLDKLNLEQN